MRAAEWIRARLETLAICHQLQKGKDTAHGCQTPRAAGVQADLTAPLPTVMS